MMDKEELLKEARRRFPIGCKVTNNNLKLPCTFTIIGSYFRFSGDRLLIDGNSVTSNTGSSYTVYYGGIWAKVISYPTTITKEQKSKILQLIKEI